MNTVETLEKLRYLDERLEHVNSILNNKNNQNEIRYIQCIEEGKELIIQSKDLLDTININTREPKYGDDFKFHYKRVDNLLKQTNKLVNGNILENVSMKKENIIDTLNDIEDEALNYKAILNDENKRNDIRFKRYLNDGFSFVSTNIELLENIDKSKYEDVAEFDEYYTEVYELIKEVNSLLELNGKNKEEDYFEFSDVIELDRVDKELIGMVTSLENDIIELENLDSYTKEDIEFFKKKHKELIDSYVTIKNKKKAYIHGIGKVYTSIETNLRLTETYINLIIKKFNKSRAEQSVESTLDFMGEMGFKF